MEGTALMDAGSGMQLALRTERGTLIGRWRGDGSIASGDVVDVEIDVERDYGIHEFEQTPEAMSRFDLLPGARTAIFGRVDEIDFQDVLTLRIGEHSLRFDTEGEVPLGLEGMIVRILVDDLQIYPTGI